MKQTGNQRVDTGAAPIHLGFGAGFEPRQARRILSATLTVDLLNSSPDFVIPSGPNAGQRVNSYTYSFFTLTPVPEPSTMILLISGGVGALSTGGRWRSRQRRA